MGKTIVLVLGGRVDRELIGKDLAQELGIEYWVTGGSGNYGDHRFLSANTVENFTSVYYSLIEEKIEIIYLVTCVFHMPRALWIGRIIFFGIDIKIFPITLDSTQSESKLKIPRDILRAIIWQLTHVF